MTHARFTLPIAACAMLVGLAGCIGAGQESDRPARRAQALRPTPIELPAAATAAVDVGIGDDRIYGRPVSWSMNEPQQRDGMLATVTESRPGVFIAWRNTNLIEEVEVRVRNLGTEEARAEVFVDVLDARGEILLHLEPPEERGVVTLPPRERGGEEGLIVKMEADRRLNRMIDLYDRARIRYDVRATVRPIDAADARPEDNVKTKAYNVPFRARAGERQTLNYAFGALPEGRRFVWHLESTELPEGWQVSGSPLDRGEFTVPNGESINGFLSVDVAEETREGDLLELRLSLLDAETREVVHQHEWFLVNDTEPPHVSNRKVTQAGGIIRMEELVADRGSGVLEASGVWVEYSTDDGMTFSQKAHNYNIGNFVDPTTFTSTIGPFRPGTKVILFLNASDTAGNVERIGPEVVEINATT